MEEYGEGIRSKQTDEAKAKMLYSLMQTKLLMKELI